MEGTIIDIFRSLAKPVPTESADEEEIMGAYNAAPIPGQSRHRVGKDPKGQASILIAVSSSTSGRTSPLRLEHLAVMHEVSSRIRDSKGNVREQAFTLITCLTPAYNRYFLRIAEAVLQTLGASPTRSDVERVVSRLSDMFESVSDTGLGTIQGLWAELLVIEQSANPSFLLEAWHSTPEDRYDFNRADQRLDVKSTADEIPRHRFSLNQLTPPPGVEAFVASVQTERAGGGTSVDDLLNRIQKRVHDAELSLKAEEIVGETLGIGNSQVEKVAFDEEIAVDSTRYFAAGDVPAPSRNLPPEVTSVKFTANLSHCKNLDITARGGSPGIIGAISGR